MQNKDNIRKYLKELKKHYGQEKCRNCECLQGFLAQLEIDGVDDKTMKEIEIMKVLEDKMCSCLGCDPCPPAEIFTSYIIEKKKLDNKK